jgi:hypothetical protein
MAERRVYEQPPKLSRAELEAEFASDDPERNDEDSSGRD